MADGLTDFRSAALRDFIEEFPEVTWTSVETDQDVYRLIAAIDHFRFVDDEWFDFENPDELPKNDSMREVIETLTAARNSELVNGYYERECHGEVNPFAERVWSYLRTKIQRARRRSQHLPRREFKPS